MIKLHKTVRMSEHIIHKSGSMKTVCVTACLTTLGVPFESFTTTYSTRTGKNTALQVLNSNGFSARSRKSKMPKNPTIGVCRKAIKKLNENTIYYVCVTGSNWAHAMLLDNEGNTIIDTAPRKKDKRRVTSIHSITLKGL